MNRDEHPPLVPLMESPCEGNIENDPYACFFPPIEAYTVVDRHFHEAICNVCKFLRDKKESEPVEDLIPEWFLSNVIKFSSSIDEAVEEPTLPFVDLDISNWTMSIFETGLVTGEEVLDKLYLEADRGCQISPSGFFMLFLVADRVIIRLRDEDKTRIFQIKKNGSFTSMVVVYKDCDWPSTVIHFDPNLDSGFFEKLEVSDSFQKKFINARYPPPSPPPSTGMVPLLDVLRSMPSVSTYISSTREMHSYLLLLDVMRLMSQTRSVISDMSDVSDVYNLHKLTFKSSLVGLNSFLSTLKFGFANGVPFLEYPTQESNEAPFPLDGMSLLSNRCSRFFNIQSVSEHLTQLSRNLEWKILLQAVVGRFGLLEGTNGEETIWLDSAIPLLSDVVSYVTVDSISTSASLILEYQSSTYPMFVRPPFEVYTRHYKVFGSWTEPELIRLVLKKVSDCRLVWIDTNSLQQGVQNVRDLTVEEINSRFVAMKSATYAELKMAFDLSGLSDRLCVVLEEMWKFANGVWTEGSIARLMESVERNRRGTLWGSEVYEDFACSTWKREDLKSKYAEVGLGRG